MLRICLLLSLPVLLSAQVVETMWISNLDAGADEIDLLSDMVVDGTGNVYATGVGYRSGHDNDIWTVAWDCWGKRLWEAFYDGSASSADSGACLARDSLGNIYVVGTSVEDSLSHLTVIKYTSTGQELWSRALCLSGDLGAWAGDIEVSELGAVYACGTRQVDSMDYDFLTIRYDPASGDTIWTRSFSRPDEVDEDRALALACDRQGNVVVTGYSYTFYYENDFATVKYDSNGSQVWVRYYNRPGSSGDGEDIPWAIAIDNAGSVIVTGQSYDSNTDIDFVTVKYGPRGDTVWTRRYNRLAVDGEDYAMALAIDRQNNVYVTGLSTDSLNGTDYATIRYTGAGAFSWIAFYDGWGLDDWATSVTVDSSGNPLVTGVVENVFTGYFDVVTLKYDPMTGVQIWTHVWERDNDVQGQKVVANQAGMVFVGTQLEDDEEFTNYGLLRLYEPTHDCGAYAFVAPVETIFVGVPFVPRIGVRNYGIYDDSVKVRLMIGRGYADSLVTFLSARTSDSFDFWPFTADSEGVYSVRCTTLLTGDVNPLNDATRATFRAWTQVGTAETRQLVAVTPRLSLAPNPTREQVLVHYSVPDAARLSLQVFDAAGRTVLVLVPGDARVQGTLPLRADQWPNGVYLVRLETPSFRAVEKLIVDR